MDRVFSQNSEAKELYLLNVPEDEPTFIYARKPEHIIESMLYCRVALGPKLLNDPKLKARWLARDISLDDIVKLRHTNLVVDDGSKNYPLFYHLRLSDDFSMDVTESSLSLLEEQKKGIPKRKIGQLYVLCSAGETSEATIIVPEDIMEAIRDFDFKDHSRLRNSRRPYSSEKNNLPIAFEYSDIPLPIPLSSSRRNLH